MNAIELYKNIVKSSKLIKQDVTKDELGDIIIEKYETDINTKYTIIKRENIPIFVLYGFDTIQFKRVLDIKIGDKLKWV